MRNGNRPTPEFRREAVRLALTNDRTRREIAEDLGIGFSRQFHLIWVQRTDGTTNGFVTGDGKFILS